jgi:Tol biopolymer transport system component
MTPKDSSSSGTLPAPSKLPPVHPRENEPADLHAQLNRILASSQFCHSERMCRFLRFTIEKTLQERQDQLKEYSIGIEVFDRNHDYDPHLDPIVRVEARRLRAKLKEYYENGGQHDDLIISLPKGSYVPVIELAPNHDKTVTDAVTKEAPVSPLRKHNFWSWILLFSLSILASAVLAIVVWQRTRPRQAFQPALTLLASDYSEMGRPAFSLDGNFIAYASDPQGEGFLNIYVKELTSMRVSRITNLKADDVSPSFSPDGTQIVFRRKGSNVKGLFVTSILGGPERQISDFGSTPKFSPDGHWIAFDVGGSDTYHSRIYLIPAAGGTPEQFQSQFAAAWLPRWSPESKHILFAGRRKSEPTDYDFWVAPLGGGPAIATGARAACLKAGLLDPIPGAWVKNHQIFFWAFLGDTTNIWRISLSAGFQAIGEPKRVTNGAGEECCPSVSDDGRVAFKNVLRETKLMSLKVTERNGSVAAEETREIGHGSYHDVSLSASSDGGNLAFVSEHGSRWDLRLKNLKDNTDQALVTAIPSTMAPDPVIRPDGSQVAYLSEARGTKDIWVVDSSGAPRRPVCDDCGLPTDWSTDGSKILFTPFHRHGPFPVSLLDLDSGKQVDLLRHPTLDLQRARFSPDTQWLTFQTVTGPARRNIYVASFRPGQSVPPSEWLQVTDAQSTNESAGWGGPNLLFFRSGRCHDNGCIWGQRLDLASRRLRGKPFAVYHKPRVPGGDRYIQALDRNNLSIGGGHLFFVTTHNTSSLWMTQVDLAN